MIPKNYAEQLARFAVDSRAYMGVKGCPVIKEQEDETDSTESMPSEESEQDDKS